MIKRLQVPFRTECVSQSVDPKSRLTAPGVRYDEEPRRTVQGVSMSSTRVKDSISHSAHNGDYHWPVIPASHGGRRGILLLEMSLLRNAVAQLVVDT